MWCLEYLRFLYFGMSMGLLTSAIACGMVRYRLGLLLLGFAWRLSLIKGMVDPEADVMRVGYCRGEVTGKDSGGSGCWYG